MTMKKVPVQSVEEGPQEAQLLGGRRLEQELNVILEVNDDNLQKFEAIYAQLHAKK